MSPTIHRAGCGLLVTSFLLSSPLLRADGGTIRLSAQKAGYRITVFTAPTPLRAGPVDVSVLVQDAATGEVIPEVEVAVQAAPRGRPDEAIRTPATTEAATNKLYHAALFVLPEPGWWEIEVRICGRQGTAEVRFEVEAAGSSPLASALWPWFTWPGLVIGLFGLHQWLARRSLPVGSGATAPPAIPAPAGRPGHGGPAAPTACRGGP